MHFASPLPWWLAVVVAAGIAGVAVYSYWRPLVPLTAAQRGVLTALRGLSLAVVAFFIARPVLLLPPVGSGDVVIPVLVDASRSMRVNDADGETRIARAADVIRRTIAPGLATHGTIELLEFGKSGSLLTPATVDSLSADGRRTELADAVQAARDRYRGRRVAGIVVLTDGEETSAAPADRPPAAQGPPVFAIGIGSPEGIPDREVASIAAGDPRLDQSLVDLHVSTVSHGFGRAPFQLRVLGNGQVLETRRVVPLADGSPVDETFSVSPDPANPTVFTAEVVADENDTIAENNARSVLVSPAARKRRILVIAGAPGFEHSFLVRALAIDPGLEVDSIVRKGKNDQNQDTFLVQAPASRVNALTGGFPATREALFDYDALVIANLEADFFTRAQLGLAAEFVGVRGGGVLVLGGRSFESRGMIGTPLEEVLPVELNDRHGSPVTAPGEDGVATQNVITPTPDGVNHPVMRIAATADASRKAWSGLPALSASAAVGGPRPGASVLAVTTTPSGAVMPAIAVQRYGRGRSMVFAGEASWRWKMMQPSTDRSYEFFWRQSLRWLTAEAPEPVSLTLTQDPEPGDALVVGVEARDRGFAPVADAVVEAALIKPGGDQVPLPLRSLGNGRFTATTSSDIAGLYRVHVEARRGTTSLGAAERWVNVGGSDREFADPRLNEGTLRRLTRESGGRYVRSADAADILTDLQAAIPQQLEPERRDLWHEPWSFAIVLALLGAEWVLRRRWGLR